MGGAGDSPRVIEPGGFPTDQLHPDAISGRRPVPVTRRPPRPDRGGRQRRLHVLPLPVALEDPVGHAGTTARASISTRNSGLNSAATATAVLAGAETAIRRPVPVTTLV